MRLITDMDGNRVICPCMVEKSTWVRMSERRRLKVADQILYSARKCPNCNLCGRGEWGEISKRDREYFDGVRVSTPARVRFLVAFRSAFRAFRRVWRGNSVSYHLPAAGAVER